MRTGALIRLATSTDLPALGALVAEYMAEHHGSGVPLPRHDQALLDALSGRPALLAFVNGTAAGCVLLDPVNQKLFVRPEYRGCGLGTALIRAGLSSDVAARDGWPVFSFDVAVGKGPAIRLYRDLGMVEVGGAPDGYLRFDADLQRNVRQV